MKYDKMVVAESSLDGAGTSCNSTAAGSSPLPASSLRGERMDKPTFVVHAYPVYVDDWRGSETRMKTTLEQRALLWELIFYAFKEGSLPTEEAILRKIADCSEKEWKRCWPAIKHKFEERGGRLHHPRVDAEMARISESKEKAARSGAAGARKRWGAYSNPMATPSKPDSTPPSTPQCDLIASNPTPILIQSNPSAAAVAAAAPAARGLTAEEWAEPDPTAVAYALVDRLIVNHPKPGNPEMAKAVASRILAGAVNMAGVVADIERTHAAWCKYWERDRKAFQPMLHRWFADGDYRHAPVQRELTAKEQGW